MENAGFCLGVERIFDTSELVVTGKVSGTVSSGSKVIVFNCGVDYAEKVDAVIKEIRIDNRSVHEVSDTECSFVLESESDLDIRIGTVVYNDAPDKAIRQSYLNALGNYYISLMHVEITDEMFSMMSLTDMAEVIHLFSNFIRRFKEKETPEIASANKVKMERLVKKICEEILKAEELYTVINKRTNEAHLFSKFIKNSNDQFYCVPPKVLLYTKASLDLNKPELDPELFEILKISNGENGEGIKNFLGTCFYLNGACGAGVIYVDSAFEASSLVEKPDYSGVPEISIPITNPEFVRWLLLASQMKKVETEDEKQYYNMYSFFMTRELKKAKLLVPMTIEGEQPEVGSNNKTVLKKDSKIGLATIKGRNDKVAVKMYSDWKRFHQGGYNPEKNWKSMIVTVAEMINNFDCVINLTKSTHTGCYIDKVMFDAIKD